jgi:hypothetical protein
MKLKNTFNNKIVNLNQNLISRQGLSDIDVDMIKKLHIVRGCYCNLIENIDDKEDLKSIRDIITQIDFKLQELWNFPQDVIYHRFWELPKCDCPKLDNIDTYGTGHRYINTNCVFHGE